MTDEEKMIRADFPLLANHDIAYLDNSATTQKPQSVIDAERDFYQMTNANPLRGLYRLSMDATDVYEGARAKLADFIGASRPEEIIFTRNATESLNLVAYSYGRSVLREGDEVIVSVAEHHSNILPWQEACRATGARLVWLECDASGELSADKLRELVNKHTKIIAISQVSNVFGRTNDAGEFARIAHEAGAVYVCDGAQSVPHMPVDVAEMDCDFLAFSGHKMLSAMGIGVLYAKYDLLAEMPPFMTGGEMIEYVTRERASYAEIPHKFEAGTVNAGGAASLAAAVDYYHKLGFERITRREKDLSVYLMEGMKRIPHVHILGSEDPTCHHGIFTFTVDGVHPHDVAAIFDASGICVRAGHHCAQPLHKHLTQISDQMAYMSTTRASLAFYNTREDLDRFLACLADIRREMGYGNE